MKYVTVLKPKLFHQLNTPLENRNDRARTVKVGALAREETCVRARLVCGVLVNSDILTANYSVKQRQFTKLTSEPPR